MPCLLALPAPISDQRVAALFRAGQIQHGRSDRLLDFSLPPRFVRSRGGVDQPQVAPVSSPLIDYLIDLIWLKLVPFGQLELTQYHLSFVSLTCTLDQSILREVHITSGTSRLLLDLHRPVPPYTCQDRSLRH